MSLYKALFAICFLVGTISSLQLNILGAAYGKADVTAMVQAAVNSDSLYLQASNTNFGDNWPGYKKSLTVVYQYDDYAPSVVAVKEGEYLSITSSSKELASADHHTNFLNILGATYGIADVTKQIKSLVGAGLPQIVAENDIFGDSWNGVLKTLVIVHLNAFKLPVVTVTVEHEHMDTIAFFPRVPLEDLKIIKAAYGPQDVSGKIINLVQQQGGKSLTTFASNENFRDSWVGTKKLLVVVYQYGNGPAQLKTAKEGERFFIPGQKQENST